MPLSLTDNAASGDLSAGKNISCWFEPGLETGLFPELKEDMQTDVVIVGAGLAGLTTAYCVASHGKKVIVIDDGAVGSGETGRTTAQIVTALDNRYFLMEDVFGKETTAAIAESHREAINFIEATVKKENIDCGFERVDGYLFLHHTDSEESLLKEFKALQRCGIPSRLLDHTPGIPNEKRSIQYSGQAQFQPIKYLLGLCKAIEKMGGKIFINTHADHIDHTGIVSSKGFIINAEHIVVATNAPVNNKYATMLKQWAYRSYVIGATIPKGKVPRALWWDTGDHHNETSTPYHYVRLEKYDESDDLLICGGEDHEVGLKNGLTEAERYVRLEQWTRERFPIKEIKYKWSGEVLVPMDSIAFIGKNVFDRENVYIITGDAGIGMTYCTMGGLLISDLIFGKQNKWEEIYKPSRFIPKASAPFFRMLKGDLVAVLKKWFYSDNVELSAIKADDAKVVILEGKKCGAYRDPSGKLFLVSAECTHLKCMVNWNPDEKSWDCPCHGSRFTYTGKVINGPANQDLPSFNDKLED